MTEIIIFVQFQLTPITYHLSRAGLRGSVVRFVFIKRFNKKETRELLSTI